MPIPSPRWPIDAGAARPDATLPNTPALYAQHAGFVWRVLARLGISEADREDLLQEVFVVVHRTRPSYRGDGRITTWLYGIALRVASRHRRRRHVRDEIHGERPPDLVQHTTPETETETRERAGFVGRLLGELSEKKRTVFVLFELEGLSCEEIAELLELPVGTIYSRLHAARAEFRLAWQRLERGVAPLTEEP